VEKKQVAWIYESIDYPYGGCYYEAYPEGLTPPITIERNGKKYKRLGRRSELSKPQEVR
jgi:hypothetical protein